MIGRYGVIIGAQKCGTTTLFHELARHPQIAASKDKEPQFFAMDDLWARGAEWYEAMWDWQPDQHRIAMEASPRYSQRHRYPHTAERMRSYGGQFRFVYLVRNPVDRIESAYRHALGVGWPLADTPLDAPGPVDPRLLDPCRYAEQLDAYVDAFGRDAILVRPFDALVRDRAGLVAAIVEHWGLDPAATPPVTSDIHNSGASRATSRRVNSARRRRWLRPVARAVVPKAVRSRAKTAVASREEPPSLPPDKRAAVLSELAPDLARLRDEWGVDITGWTLAA